MSSNLAVPSKSSPAKSGSGLVKPVPVTDLELRDIVKILRRRKEIIFAGIAIGTIIAFFSVFFAQKQYSATATIEVNKGADNSLGLADLSGIASGLGAGEEMNTDLLTQQAVIMSDNTAIRVIKSLKLDSAPPYAIPPAKDGKITALDRERGLSLEQAPLQRDRVLNIFRTRLGVGLIKGTRLLTVTYTDPDPERATAVANAVVDAYINEYTQARFQASSKASTWLTQQLADLKDKVEASQAKVDEFQRQSGLTGLTFSSSGRAGEPATATTSDNVPLQRLIELNRNLTNAEVERIAKEAIYRMTDTQDPGVVLGIGSSGLAAGVSPDSPLAPGSADLTLLQQLRSQQAQLSVQLAAAETKYGAKNPVMLQLKTQEASLNGQIHTELERIRARAKNDLDLATLAENGIRQQITAQEQEVNKATAKADQLILLQEEALSSREIYQDLYTKLEEANVAAGIRASNITLVNPARTPVRPSSPKTKATIMVGSTIGMVLGLMGAFLWDYFDDSISVPEQVEQISTTPVIGVIPDFAQKSVWAIKYGKSVPAPEPAEDRSLSWLLRAPRSNVAESYRTLRTALLLSKIECPPRVVLVVSGSPEEGKSTTCLNISTAFALQGDRVLYLDADMRRATAHRAFNFSNEAGLSNCLTSGAAFRQVIRQFPEIENGFLLPAGPHPPNPSELLGSKRFADLLEELKHSFDHIFIDTPPVLLVTDAQLISSLADGYIVVLRSGRTTKRALQRCLTVMAHTKAPALGVVVNAINSKSAGYSGYGSYYGSGNGYYVDEA